MTEQPSYSAAYNNYSVAESDEDDFFYNSDTTEEYCSIEETQEFDYSFCDSDSDFDSGRDDA